MGLFKPFSVRSFFTYKVGYEENNQKSFLRSVKVATSETQLLSAFRGKK
jgi:hypothetical protein